MSDATPFYRLAQVVLRTGFRALQGLQVDGLEHVPARGPCLIVSNHLSWLDPPALGCALAHRQVHFMAKQELFERPLLGPVIRALGAFPVERGQADRKSLRQALEILGQGRIVAIFPEGTRGEGGEMQPWHVGMAMLAHHAQVDIVPVAILGSRQLLEERHLRQSRTPLRLRFGPPVSPAQVSGRGRHRLQEIQDQSRRAVARLITGLST